MLLGRRRKVPISNLAYRSVQLFLLLLQETNGDFKHENKLRFHIVFIWVIWAQTMMLDPVKGLQIPISENSTGASWYMLVEHSYKFVRDFKKAFK